MFANPAGKSPILKTERGRETPAPPPNLKGKEAPALKATSAVLVCVTGQRDCDRLIRAGRVLAGKTGAGLHVLCVQPIAPGGKPCGEELEYLRQTARDADAEMTVYFQDNAPVVAASFARHIGARHIFTGMAEAPVNGFVEILHKLLPKIPISMVAKDGTIYNIWPREARSASRAAASLAAE